MIHLLKAFRFRIYPTEEQKTLLAKTFGCCRFVYNCFLDRKASLYENERKKLSYGDCARVLTEMKTKKPWLAEVDAIALQQSLRDLDQAYANFFHGSGFPKFKSRHSNSQSYRTQMVNGNIKVDGNRIKLPKLGWIRFAKSREAEGSIRNVTVCRTPAGRYFMSICCEVEIRKLPKLENRAGVDMGIKHFCHISNADPVENPKYLKRLEKQLAKAMACGLRLTAFAAVRFANAAKAAAKRHSAGFPQRKRGAATTVRRGSGWQGSMNASPTSGRISCINSQPN